MPTLQCVLRPCEDKIVASVIDGEAVMINLASGVYYSMGNSGGLIWELITAGHSLGAVATALSESYEVATEDARSDVLVIASQLVEEELVRVDEAETPPPAPVAPRTAPRLVYQTPKLEIYRDIGHLVALDPPMPGLRDLPWKGPTDG